MRSSPFVVTLHVGSRSEFLSDFYQKRIKASTFPSKFSFLTKYFPSFSTTTLYLSFNLWFKAKERTDSTDDMYEDWLKPSIFSSVWKHLRYVEKSTLCPGTITGNLPSNLVYRRRSCELHLLWPGWARRITAFTDSNFYKWFSMAEEKDLSFLAGEWN